MDEEQIAGLIAEVRGYQALALNDREEAKKQFDAAKISAEISCCSRAPHIGAKQQKRKNWRVKR